ncbi:regulatory protein RecX [Halopseudomonas salegens]|uniref:Regulatory protein RecX n=1 Tax=Halopseudomonas salegens TaxID=1434072 RepID=A0A1H2EN17_9GAMM|nr:regulatory protein RecX [Halopseudomonas salegens]SDT96343.1 regulatory protein [Halopseudomonas salegens]
MFRRSQLETPQAIRRSAMDLLARREHSYTELLRKLTLRGATADAAEIELDKLQDEGLLSDARFCEAYVYARSQRGMGPLRLREELRQKGVASSLIEQVLDEPHWDWPAKAAQAFAKRFPDGVAAERKEKARQQRFMQYRGFTWQDLTVDDHD